MGKLVHRMQEGEKSGSGGSHSLLAWAGWSLNIPVKWQPLKITGTLAKGQIIVGDATCAFFMLNWEKSKPGSHVDVQNWAAERLKKHHVVPQPNPPAEEHFTACGWASDVHTKEGNPASYWYGYSEPARLFMGVVVNGAMPETDRNTVTGQVISTLRTTPADSESLWAMYDVSFRVPAGFVLSQRHLYSGDVALEFIRGKRETLLVRQVYPGDLALGRRSLEKWLESYPFKEHRRLCRSDLRIEPREISSRTGMSGLRRIAWKKLPAPMGWCAPRRTCALVVHDEALNRLLIAEFMSKNDADHGLCDAAIMKMNEEFKIAV